MTIDRLHTRAEQYYAPFPYIPPTVPIGVVFDPEDSQMLSPAATNFISALLAAGWMPTEGHRPRCAKPTAWPYVELYKMLYGAEADYKSFHGLPDQASEFDIHLTVDVGDDEILVYFEYPGTARTQARAATAAHGG
jgi:hypothetical protein